MGFRETRVLPIKPALPVLSPLAHENQRKAMFTEISAEIWALLLHIAKAAVSCITEGNMLK